MKRKLIQRLLTLIALIGSFLPLSCGEEPDSELPTVSIDAPGNGQMISADTLIEATVKDNEGIAKVEFAVDDVILAEIDAPPYEHFWVIADYTDGQAHRIQVAATDTSGNLALSDYVTVMVAAP